MKPSVSFEFYPPKTEDGVAPLMQAAKDLAALKPAFMTMTYGAGGNSASTATSDLALKMQRETGVPAAAHITFINLNKAQLAEFAATLWQNGITRIIALRGDFPPGWQAPDYAKGEHYRYTDEFVRGLKSQHDFDISVGAYPEKHPDAPDLSADIEALRKKCGAGATRAITQFFFDNASYYRFLDLVEKAGIKTPVVPGLLPIQNFERAKNFAKKCGAQIPAWLEKRFEGLSDADAAKAAEEVLVTQVKDLAAQGVSHFHFYALNKSQLCQSVCQKAGLV